MKPELVVLAAGMGSRFGGVKQIAKVGPAGECIIDYSLRDAARSGFGRVVFVIRRDIEADVKAFFAGRIPAGMEVAWAFQDLADVPKGFSVPQERSKPWGTGHAVWAARSAIQGNFAVINADDYYGAEAFSALARGLDEASPDSLDLCMVGYALENTLSEHGSVSRGVCEVDRQGYLVRVTEHTKLVREADMVRNLDPANPVSLSLDTTVSMNCFGFTKSFIDHLGPLFEAHLNSKPDPLTAEFYLPFAVNTLVQKGQARMKVIKTKASWFGITYREDQARVAAMLARMESGQ